ncbi:MAG: DUF2101 family protein [Candidatus Diapherotrites archaeon]|nr:DUF2101 family protein [Candidatus Diapherotrites archaeon]
MGFNFFRDRIKEQGGSEAEYIILRTQLATLTLFIFAIFTVFSQSYILLSAVVLLFLLNVYSVIKQLKTRDKRAYEYFFIGLNVLGVLLAAFNFVFPGFHPIYALAYLGIFFIFLIVFHVFFKRNFTYGEVLVSDGEWAVVKAHYDLCSGVKNGFYAVRSKKGIKKGKEVKISVKGFLGERRMPWKVIG